MKLMTTDEVADLLRIPKSTLRYWRSIDKGPVSSKLGRVIVYKPEDVDAWVDESMASTRRGGL